jgi:hypothetical protein
LHPSFVGNAKIAAAVGTALWTAPQAGLALPVRSRPAVSIEDPISFPKLASTTLKAWWRADAVATATSGTTVTRFYDKSGNGNDGVVTGSAAFLPNFGSVTGATGNNRPAVHLNNGPIAKATFACPTPLTWVIVFAMNALGTFGVNDLLITGQGGSGAGITLFMADAAHQFMYNGAFGFFAMPVAVTPLQVFVGIFVFNGATSIEHINGVETTANAGTTQVDSAFFCIGAYSDQTRPVDVYVLEAQAHQGAMSASDRAVLSAGLQKYHRLTL